MTRQINDYCIELLKQWEGFKDTAYQDSGDVWTIGYGHTGEVHKGQKVTLAEAEQLLRQDLAKFESCVEQSVTVPLSDFQFGALVSFCYNIGPENFKKSSLLKKLNSGQYQAVPFELMKWVKCKGKNLSGLVVRRSHEASLWSMGITTPLTTEKPDLEVKNSLQDPNFWTPKIGILSAILLQLIDVPIMKYSLVAIFLASFAAFGYYYYNNLLEKRL